MKRNRKKDILLLLLLFLTFYLSLNNIIYATKIRSNKSETTVVEKFGLLKVEGNKIVDRNGNPVVFRGMSLFWSQWIGKYYNYDCIKWLRDDWKCTVVRAAMAVESGGYLANPNAEMAKIKTVIDACIDLGIYVIIDWHDHNAQLHTNQSISFFQEIARTYGDKPNIIYEIFNEPLQVSWLNIVKPYADSVVKYIRAIDQDNMIIVGSPTWSQDVDIAALYPVQSNNIAYSLHFYAATHKLSLRNKAATALKRGIALFVTEFGTCESSGTGAINYNELDSWFDFMEKNKISWCNWSIADKNETSAALNSGASQYGNWSLSEISESGQVIMERIQNWNDSVFTSVNKYEPFSELPFGFHLYQNFPNPFNPTTTISYELKKDGFVDFNIYDLTGKKIKTLIKSYQVSGSYLFTWDGNTDANSKAASGIYFFQLNFDNKRQIRKGILLN
jgi:endoglucanase